MDAKTEKELIRRIPDGEPLFILRAQDILAADLVGEWCARAEAAGVRSGKIAGARDIERNMRAWEPRKLPD